MKAVVWTRYGSPEGLELRELAPPVPAADEILVRIRAAGVTAGDCEMRRLALPLGLSFPMRLYSGFAHPKRIPVLGQEFAGEVVQVGQDVETFAEGDRVFGTTGFRFGAYAELIAVKAKPAEMGGVVAKIPEVLSFEEAAVLPTAGLEALHYLTAAAAGAGSNVLIFGAGGSIGSCAVQIARHFGAKVTALDRREKHELLRSLGAKSVADSVTAIPPGGRDGLYDIVIDVVGRRGVARRLRLLRPGGTYFLAYAGVRHVLLSAWRRMTGRSRLRITSSPQDKTSLERLTALVVAGAVRPVVDRAFSMEEAAEAHRYAESGNKRGNVVMVMQ